MFTQKSKLLWCVVVFVACIPMLIREIPEKYDYLLVMTLAIGVLVLTLLWVFAKQRFMPIETFAKSRYKLPILIFGALMIGRAQKNGHHETTV